MPNKQTRLSIRAIVESGENPQHAAYDEVARTVEIGTRRPPRAIRGEPRRPGGSPNPRLAVCVVCKKWKKRRNCAKIDAKKSMAELHGPDGSERPWDQAIFQRLFTFLFPPHLATHDRCCRMHLHRANELALNNAHTHSPCTSVCGCVYHRYMRKANQRFCQR